MGPSLLSGFPFAQGFITHTERALQKHHEIKGEMCICSHIREAVVVQITLKSARF